MGEHQEEDEDESENGNEAETANETADGVKSGWGAELCRVCSGAASIQNHLMAQSSGP